MKLKHIFVKLHREVLFVVASLWLVHFCEAVGSLNAFGRGYHADSEGICCLHVKEWKALPEGWFLDRFQQAMKHEKMYLDCMPRATKNRRASLCFSSNLGSSLVADR